jgi:hypothetical protein
VRAGPARGVQGVQPGGIQPGALGRCAPASRPDAGHVIHAGPPSSRARARWSEGHRRGMRPLRAAAIAPNALAGLGWHAAATKKAPFLGSRVGGGVHTRALWRLTGSGRLPAGSPGGPAAHHAAGPGPLGCGDQAGPRRIGCDQGAPRGSDPARPPSRKSPLAREPRRAAAGPGGRKAGRCSDSGPERSSVRVRVSPPASLSRWSSTGLARLLESVVPLLDNRRSGLRVGRRAEGRQLDRDAGRFAGPRQVAVDNGVGVGADGAGPAGQVGVTGDG